MCPHTATYVSASCYICVVILLLAIDRGAWGPRGGATLAFSSQHLYWSTSPACVCGVGLVIAIYVSSYYYMRGFFVPASILKHVTWAWARGQYVYFGTRKASKEKVKSQHRYWSTSPAPALEASHSRKKNLFFLIEKLKKKKLSPAPALEVSHSQAKKSPGAQLLSQHLYFCTSKASKLSVSVLVTARAGKSKKKKSPGAPSASVVGALYQQLRQYVYFCISLPGERWTWTCGRWQWTAPVNIKALLRLC